MGVEASTSVHHQDSRALVTSLGIPGELPSKFRIAVAVCNRLRIYGHVQSFRAILSRHRDRQSGSLRSCHESPLVTIPYR